MQHLTRFIGAVIVMIAFLVASSAAQAHGGHDHAASPESSASSAGDASIVVAAMGDTAATPSVQEISERASLLSHSGTDNRCLGRCCSSAHLCCVASLPTTVDPVFPILFGPSSAFAEPVFENGLDPEALRRPPRSFA